MNLLFPQGVLADRRLAALGLQVTQGGEPTFVPPDHSKPEWNSAALGDEKLFLARRLARHLIGLFLPGALILQSFGKQYPGEPLPRWRIGLYRRRDPAALWSDLSLLRLDQPTPPPPSPDLPALFLAALRARLDLANTVSPVYENVAERLWAARQGEGAGALPRFSRRHGRFELARKEEEGLGAWSHLLQPSGYVLPLDFKEGRWLTEAWATPLDEGLTLIPGDSPVGLRLPLSTLPPEAARTALTSEIKNGELVVFLPPLPTLEAFCRLVQAVEHVVVSHGFPAIALEGYPPPDDPDLASISWMADPGVIEVNLPPCGDWARFEALIQTLFIAAEQTGLQGFKFHYSGKKTGTGGGAHIILGGPDLDHNPFIQQPALLSSFLRFIQNHPSLSFLFTGAFVGPSSQAPRVDESAFEVPYELELTLRALEKMSRPGDPQLMDAMLRNLLLDLNGNTHRAEISIDKFYNPWAPNGRLGLVEFRAFEMMPSAEMFLAVNAFIRALAACFAEEPFTAALVDWREALHDRFALPYFIWGDFSEALAFLRAKGFDFPPGLFEAHLDFRFPILFEWETGEAVWQLRQALEPWPVMGEAANSRAVDASTDRLQLTLRGSAAKRGGATVNGFTIPLLPQPDGSALGAIRYRLFDNPFGLQPQIKAHSPLVFECLDLDRQEILFAFDYLNWRPGGGGYEGLPFTAEDAARRVQERIQVRPGRKGCRPVIRETRGSAHAPHTLDLRAQ